MLRMLPFKRIFFVLHLFLCCELLQMNLLPSSQIISCSNFSRYIDISMHIKIIHLEKSKRLIIQNGGVGHNKNHTPLLICRLLLQFHTLKVVYVQQKHGNNRLRLGFPTNKPSSLLFVRDCAVYVLLSCYLSAVVESQLKK